jgi:hypothetical protein
MRYKDTKLVAEKSFGHGSMEVIISDDECFELQSLFENVVLCLKTMP